MKRRRLKKSVRITGRLFILLIFLLSIISTLGYTLFNNIIQLNILNDEMNNLNKKLSDLKEEEAALSADIEKLSDSGYVARYAREKYLYSKDGELIIRMDE